MPTTTKRSGTKDNNVNTTTATSTQKTTEQRYNEPSEEYITIANNVKKWRKESTGKQKNQQNEGKKTQEYQPKWLRQIESKIKV